MSNSAFIETNNALYERRKKGRKFTVVIIASILLTLGMIAGVIGAYRGLELPWLGVTLPILAGTLPSYIGANAYQKKVEAKDD